MRKLVYTNAHAQLASRAFYLNLPIHPYIMCASSKGSDENAHNICAVSSEHWLLADWGTCK